MYVALEGIDTSGKSTQIKALEQEFKQAIITKEPGGTKFGQIVREIILEGKFNLCSNAEFFLFLADRAEHFDKVIKPHLQDLVIADRSLISGIAYAQYSDLKYTQELNLLALQNHLPDLVVLLKIDPQTLIQRLKHKQQDHVESRGIDFLLSVQDKMEEAITALNINSLILPANAPIDFITQAITEHIHSLIPDN